MFDANIFAALANKGLLHDPAYYGVIWTLLGILCLFVIVAGVVLIFYFTRKKEVKTLAHLPVQQPKVIDLAALKSKYLAMIDETLRRYNNKEIKASVAHQEFSLTVRLFYAEANGFHAEVMTLKDIQRSKNQKLAELIKQYYPDEFDTLEKGSVANSADFAKTLIANGEKNPQIGGNNA